MALLQYSLQTKAVESKSKAGNMSLMADQCPLLVYECSLFVLQ
jgi:hypothetical protein